MRRKNLKLLTENNYTWNFCLIKQLKILSPFKNLIIVRALFAWTT